ncbi:Lysosome-associated membrane glycoprotein 1 [Anthophora plagiata]
MKCYVQLFLLSGFIVAATCFHFHGNDDGLAWKFMVENDRMNDDTEDKLTPDKFTYKVKRTSKDFCILANMRISLALPEIKDSKTLNVPSNATAEGTCSSLISELKLSWNETSEGVNVIKFTFINDHTSFSVFSIDVDIALDKTNFPNADKPRFKGSSKNLRLFHASVKNGRHTCATETQTIEKMNIAISNVSLIAFNTENDISKRIEEKCNPAEKKEETFPYKLTNNAGDFCTLAKWSIVFDIPYKRKDNQIKPAKVNVPSEVQITGHCDTRLSQMTIIWPKTASLAANGTQNSVTFLFTKNETNTFVYSMLASIYIEEKNFPNATELGTQVKVNTMLDYPMFFAQAENGVYSCENAKTLTIEGVNVTISDVILIAFDAQNELATKRVTDCRYAFSKDDFNYILYDTENSIPCTLARMKITMNVPYETTANSNASKMLTVPSKLDVSGVCDPQWPTLTLSWPWSSKKTLPNNTITFYITHKATNFYVYRIDTIVQLDDENFPTVDNKQKSLSGSTNGFIKLFPADASVGLYRCKESIHQVKLGVIDLNITDVLFVAYNKEEDLNTKKVNDCSVLSTTTESPTEKTAESSSISLTTSTTKLSTITTTVSPPTTDPSVKKYNYVVTNPQTHIPCVLANMMIHLTITYKTKDSEKKTKTLQVSDKSETRGTCEDTKATMSLTWTPEVPKYETVQNTVTFIFHKDNSTFHLETVNVDFNLDEKNFPDATEKKYNVTTKKLNEFSTSVKNMYKCSSATLLDASDVQIRIEDVALIAFNTEKSVASRTEEVCKADVETDTNVGAIVGGIIGGLILLSIIIYVFISWRRGRFYR